MSRVHPYLVGALVLASAPTISCNSPRSVSLGQVSGAITGEDAGPDAMCAGDGCGSGRAPADAQVAPPPRPVVKCLATCYLKTDVTYKLVRNVAEQNPQNEASGAILFGAGLLPRAWANHATRTGDNPAGHAAVQQTTTLDPTIVCEYSPTCDAQNNGSCAVGTDETYWMQTSAEIRAWNRGPTRGTGSNNQVATSDLKLGVGNPLIPGSYIDAHQNATADGAGNQQVPPNVFDLIKVNCKLGFQADPKKPVTFKCNLDFDPIEVLNALFWKPTRRDVEPREVVTSGAVPTIWTTPPIPPAFTAGVAARTSAQISNQRTGSLSMDTFAASHCLTGPCTWAGNRPEAYGQASGYVGITATKIKPVISVGDFACYLGGRGWYNWWLPGIKKGPQGTPVLVDSTTNPPDPPSCGDGSDAGACTGENPEGDGSEEIDESLYTNQLAEIGPIAPDDRSYEDYLAQTGDGSGSGSGSGDGSGAGSGSGDGSGAGSGSGSGDGSGSGSGDGSGSGSGDGSGSGSGSGSGAGSGSGSGSVSGSGSGSGSGGGGGCTATYTIAAQWPGGFTAGVTVTNGATVSTGWTITWTFAGDQSVSAVWNGLDTSSGATHSVRNLSYNGSLAPNQSTTFGFNATGNATGAIPTLTCTRS